MPRVANSHLTHSRSLDLNTASNIDSSHTTVRVPERNDRPDGGAIKQIELGYRLGIIKRVDEQKRCLPGSTLNLIGSADAVAPVRVIDSKVITIRAAIDAANRYHPTLVAISGFPIAENAARLLKEFPGFTNVNRNTPLEFVIVITQARFMAIPGSIRDVVATQPILETMKRGIFDDHILPAAAYSIAQYPDAKAKDWLSRAVDTYKFITRRERALIEASRLGEESTVTVGEMLEMTDKDGELFRSLFSMPLESARANRLFRKLVLFEDVPGRDSR